MSADEPSGPSPVAADTDSILGEVEPEGAVETPPDSRKEREDRFSGLRDLAKQKESWSRWLRAILIIAFLLQVGVVGVAVFVGEGWMCGRLEDSSCSSPRCSSPRSATSSSRTVGPPRALDTATALTDCLPRDPSACATDMPSPRARDAPPETPVPEQPAPQTGRPPEIEAERLDDRPAPPEGKGPRAADRHGAGRRLVLVAARIHLRSRRSMRSRAWTRIRRTKPRTKGRSSTMQRNSGGNRNGGNQSGRTTSSSMRPPLSHRPGRLTPVYDSAGIVGPIAIGAPAHSACRLSEGDFDDRPSNGTGDRCSGRQP